jgi:hypothetical protein
MTEEELITRVTQELKALSSNFIAVDYTNAVDAAEIETGFTLPSSVSSKIRWLIQRTKRHLLYSLWIQNASKFKVKQLSLDQKFDHLGELVKNLDSEYRKALDSADFDMVGAAWEQLGHKIDAGFLNDPVTGEDLTYFDDNSVTITPTGSESV